MTAFSHSAFLQALGWAVLNSLWQMALLWVIYNTVLSIPRQVRPSHKSSIAAAMLFTGFTWFLFTFCTIYIYKNNTNAILTLNALPAGTNETLNAWLNSTLPFASLVYMILLIIPLYQFARNYRYVQVLRKRNLGKMNVEWRMFVRKVAAQIGITKPVNIWVSEFVSSPVTVGYLKPIILVPLAAINNLTTQQLEAILLHELAHIRRYDYLINLIINFIQAILYFNPFVKAFVKTIEKEREKSCDEMVMQFQYDPHNYASALLTLEKNNTLPQKMAIAASGKSDLLNRVERILKIDTAPVFSFNKLAGLFAGLLCILVLNTLVIVGKPLTKNGSFVFEQLGSPASMFSTDEETAKTDRPDSTQSQNSTAKENKTSTIENHIAISKSAQKTITDLSEENIEGQPAEDGDDMNEEPAAPSLFTTVKLTSPVAPVLNKRELKQVEQAVMATKKVLEDAQWKEVEKSIADALTSIQKQAVKEKYLHELSKVNWKGLENKLKASYDHLNWDKIGAQINTAMASIKLDSLVEVYSAANDELHKAEEMAADREDSVNIEIAMPDVSLEKIRQSKQQAQKSLNKLKIIRSRKTIHL